MSNILIVTRHTTCGMINMTNCTETVPADCVLQIRWTEAASGKNVLNGFRSCFIIQMLCCVSTATNNKSVDAFTVTPHIYHLCYNP